MNGPVLHGERLRLRPVERRDNALLLKWRNSPSVSDWMFSETLLTTRKQESWFRTYLLDATQVRFIIEDLNGRAVGSCGLTGIDSAAASASLTIFIGEDEARGRGLAAQSLRLLLDYASVKLRIRTVRAELFADNLPARKLYGAMGFKETGSGSPRRGRAVDCMAVELSGEQET